MKKQIASIIMTMIICESMMPVCANENSETILFRNYEWGINLENIMEKEIEEGMVESEDYLLINDTLLIADKEVAGLSTNILYMFDNEMHLEKGMYQITEEHTNENAYYNDYIDLVDKYEDKYGEPIISEALWNDDLYKKDSSDWGFAVSIGDVSSISAWEKEDGSNVGIMLSGDNYEINLFIVYQSPIYEYQENTDGI